MLKPSMTLRTSTRTSVVVFTAMHSISDFNIIARLNWFGESTNSNTRSGSLVFQDIDAIYMFDLEGQWQITDMFRVSVGGRNIFDEYPPRDTIGDFCCGRIYSSGTIVPWQGGYYFARLQADFN